MLDLPKPNPVHNGWLTDKMWGELLEITAAVAEFKGFESLFVGELEKWQCAFESKNPIFDIAKLLSEQYSDFHILLVTKCIRPDVIIPGITNFIENQMGKRFVEVPPFNIRSCYEDSTCSTPIIFVLTPGADPMTALLKLSKEIGGEAQSMTAISLGQGQGPLAEAAMNEAMDKGQWVCLQNCHLCVSWMPSLERLCEAISPNRVNANFRLWLTSEPSTAFPSSILQNGIKLTIEPPKGMRANLLGSYYSLENDFLEGSKRQNEFKRLLFALCFFHASVRERKRFGPIGWNNSYIFSGSDLKISMNQLRLFLDASFGENIPYAALHYLTAECNYGGRVTDDKDRRLLANLLDDFYCEDIQIEGRPFSSSGSYHMPQVGDLQLYRMFIEGLPLSEGPEVFGLHENANISCAISETNVLLQAALDLQPRSIGSNDGKSWSEQLSETVNDVLKRLPSAFDTEKALLDFPMCYAESMNTVLCQELLRYNRLTNTIKAQLREIQRAIKGLVVMSSDLEEAGNSLVLGFF